MTYEVDLKLDSTLTVIETLRVTTITLVFQWFINALFVTIRCRFHPTRSIPIPTRAISLHIGLSLLKSLHKSLSRSLWKSVSLASHLTRSTISPGWTSIYL